MIRLFNWSAIITLSLILPVFASAKINTNKNPHFVLKGLCQPVNGNEVFFDGKKVFHTFYGRPVPLTFFVKGKKNNLKNPSLALYLPKTIDLLDIFQGKLYGGGIQYDTERTRTNINGQVYYRYQITSDLTSAITNNYNPKHACQIAVALDATHKKLKQETIYWSLINNGRETSKNHIIVKFLNPLPVPEVSQEGEFRIMSYRPMSGLAYHGAKLQKKAADLLLASGIKGNGAFHKRSTRRGQFDKYLRSRGVSLFAGGFWGGPLWHRPVAGVPPTITAKGIVADRTTKNKEGKKIVHVLSPVAALNSEKYKDFYFKQVKKLLERVGPCEYAVFDYEPWRWATTYGFDKKTMSAFAHKYNIHTELTPEIILEKYPKKWTKFWIYISTRAIAMMANACKAVNPDIKVIDYTYFYNYQKPLTGRFMRCPKDPSKYDKYVDGVMLSAYHYNGKQLVNQLRLSKKYIRRADIGVIASLSRSNILQGGYTKPDQALSPQRIYQKAILCAALGVKRFGLWPGRLIDGAFYVSLGKAARLIWNHEKFYYHGMNVHDQVRVQPADSTKGGAFAYTAQQYNGKRLISLFNFLDKPLQLQVHMKGSSWAKSYTLPAHGVKLIKIK